MSYLTNPYRYVSPVIYPDSCGTTANGTADGALVVGSGKFTNAISFDGTDDFVSCGGVYDSSGCGMNATGTISCWCSFDTLDVGGDGGGKICAFGDASANTFIELGFSDAGALLGQGRLAGSKKWACYSSGSLLTTSGFYLCSITHDGTQPKLYVNGIEDTTFSITTDKTLWVGSLTGVDEFRLGMQYHSGGSDGFFDGLMSDIGIYDRDIGQTLMTELATGVKVSEISTVGCIAYYQPTALVSTTLTNNAIPTS